MMPGVWTILKGSGSRSAWGTPSGRQFRLGLTAPAGLAVPTEGLCACGRERFFAGLEIGQVTQELVTECCGR